MSVISDHVDDIMEEVDAERSEVRQSLENLIVYSVPAEEAKKSVIRKYSDKKGGNGA